MERYIPKYKRLFEESDFLAAAFPVHKIRTELGMLSVEDNTSVASRLFNVIVHSDSDARDARAKNILSMQLGKRTPQGFFDLSRINRYVLAENVCNDLDSFSRITDNKKREHIADALTLVEPYLPRDRETQKRVSDVCGKGTIRCAIGSYTDQERTALARLEEIREMLKANPTWGPFGVSNELRLPLPVVECYFDRLIEEHLVEDERRFYQADLKELFGNPIIFDAQAQTDMPDSLNSFFHIFVVYNHTLQLAAQKAGISEAEGEAYLTDLQQRGMIRQETPDPEEKTLRRYLAAIIESDFSITATATRLGISYHQMRKYAEELLTRGLLPKDYTARYRNAKKERIRNRAQQFSEFMAEHPDLSIREGARRFGISKNMATSYRRDYPEFFLRSEPDSLE